MSRKTVILICIGCGALLLALACGLLFYRPPAPAMQFVGFSRVGQIDEVAIVRISNNSRVPFSYFGYGPRMPHYSWRVIKSTSWRKQEPGWCGTGAGLQTIGPHSSIDIEVQAPYDVPPSPYAVGIRFYRGNAASLYSTSYLATFRGWIRHMLDPDGPEPTWSEAIPRPPVVSRSEQARF